MVTKKLTLHIFEMPGCARIYGSLHMVIYTAVSIDTIKALRSDLRFCSCKLFSTQYHTVTIITHDEYAALFSWKGDSL